MSEARHIAADTPPFERFRVGDTVAHIRLGDGVVTANDGTVISVTYSRCYSRGVAGVGGQPIKQNYDAHWFKSNPRYLFHRSA